MEEVVLDSSVIIKSILKPGRWLPKEVYKRELETHYKARTLVKTLKSSDITVLIPYPVIVEVGAVIARRFNVVKAWPILRRLRLISSYKHKVTIGDLSGQD